MVSSTVEAVSGRNAWSPGMVTTVRIQSDPVNVEPLALEKPDRAETQRPRPKLSFKDLSAIDQITVSFLLQALKRFDIHYPSYSVLSKYSVT